jgi:hypothetical protein
MQSATRHSDKVERGGGHRWSMVNVELVATTLVSLASIVFVYFLGKQYLSFSVPQSNRQAPRDTTEL